MTLKEFHCDFSSPAYSIYRGWRGRYEYVDWREFRLD
jgi:hypothetical protein